MRVLLTEQDLEDARRYARLRTGNNRQAGTTCVKRANFDGLEADFQGMCGEIAFCKAFNLPFDRSVGPRSGGVDTTLYGYRFDVKATKLKNGRLLATTKVNDEIDAYALALLHELPWVELRGYELKGIFIVPENLLDLGHGLTYALGQGKLRLFKADKCVQSNDDWLAEYRKTEAVMWGSE